MKYLFLITAIWFVVSQACNQNAVGTNQKSPQKAELKKRQLPKKPDSIALVSDSLKHELCFRIWRVEQGLEVLKKKHWPKSETMNIYPVRASDPIYCKSNNPPY